MALLTLLDGGMGQELVARSGDEPTPLWATRVMIDHPGLVKAIHDDYFAAGASVATNNIYNILHDRLVGVGLDHLYHALHLRALWRRMRPVPMPGVASSQAPWDLWAARPDACGGRLHRAVAEKATLMAPHVDVILCETMSSLDLCRGALAGAQAAGKPVWLTVSVDDRDGSRRRLGEPVAGLEQVMAEHPTAAIWANCSMPESMEAALAVLRSMNRPFGEVGPAHIRHLAAALKAAGHTLA